MITISLCMIVKDEEYTLKRCLDYVKDIADEIIIVDTGSKDKTKDIAVNYGASVYDFVWTDDFSKARNFSFSKASKDYILWLDADDILPEDSREKLLKLKETLDPDIDIVMMKYMLGMDVNGRMNVTFMRERLVKRSRCFTWHGSVHEYLVFKGKILISDICIIHKKVRSSGDRNLRIFQNMIASGVQLDDRSLFYYARELYINKRLDEAIAAYNRFLETENGPKSNYSDACLDLSKCYLLKNDRKNALRALIRSFEFGYPRADICCQLGQFYKSAEDYEKAVFWFRLATQLRKPSDFGSIAEDYWGYIPLLELSLCYYRTGDIREAITFNNKALELKPDAPEIHQNKRFLEGVVQSILQF